MKISTLLLFSGLVLVPSPGTPQANQTTNSPWSLVERALMAHRDIKPGVRRRDVEKNFTYDGGAQFPDRGRYTYRGCPYLKLEVHFETKIAGSPEDTVTGVSKLFVDYPTKD